MNKGARSAIISSVMTPTTPLSRPGRGMEDTKDYGLVDGEPFPADHELLPRIWPKRPRAEWPRPTGWNHLPQGVVTYRDAGIPGEGPGAAAGE